MNQRQSKFDITDFVTPTRTVLDVILVLLVVAVVITIAATGPSTTYAYAQLQQIGAVVGSIESGNWLLPRDQFGGLAIKPQLYAWIDGRIYLIRLQRPIRVSGKPRTPPHASGKR